MLFGDINVSQVLPLSDCILVCEDINDELKA